MNMNDLEKVNELAARWRQLDEMCRADLNKRTIKLIVDDMSTSHQINPSPRYFIEIEPKVAFSVLEQLKRDVEAQLRNHGVTPPVAADKPAKAMNFRPGHEVVDQMRIGK